MTLATVRGAAHRAGDEMEPNQVAIPEKSLALPAAVKAELEKEEDKVYARSMPEPKGFKLLIGLPEVAKKTEGGIDLSEARNMLHQEEISTVVGFVIKMGPDAYKDTKRFPNGPYCKEGDFVLFRAFSGTRVKIYGKEFRLINDDTVEAVVEDPRGITRA